MNSVMRKEIARAKLNEDAFNMVLVEVFLASAAAGILAASCWVFGAVLLALLIVLGFRRIAIGLVVLLSLVWGVIGALIGFWAGSVIAWVLLAILVLQHHFGIGDFRVVVASRKVG